MKQEIKQLIEEYMDAVEVANEKGDEIVNKVSFQGFYFWLKDGSLLN